MNGLATLRALALCALGCWLAAAPASAEESRTVLVIYSNNRLLPGNVALDRGLREALSSPAAVPVRVFSEFLDSPNFTGPAHEDNMARYLHAKYAARPPDAILAASDSAVDFVLRKRDRLFPGVPIVHASASKAHLQSLPALPADLMGVPIEYDFAGTIEQALRWHPGARRLLIVTGASERDRSWEARLRREAPGAAPGVPIEFLAGLPTPALLQRLGVTGPDSVVFTPGFYEDGEGRVSNPRDTAAQMAVAATAPVYGPLDTFIGSGVVAVLAPSFEAMGRQAALTLRALFAGTAPGAMTLPKLMPNQLIVDWRQARRWGISDNHIPADAIVQFRQPTLWQAHRNEVLAIVAVVLLQAALIVALLFERRRRHAAEGAVQQQRSELAHASRLAVAGELTASIAHEINQPLAAILTNAEAAEMLLDSGADRRDDLRHILADIRRDDQRASDVIRRLRDLLAKQGVEKQAFELNATASEVAVMLGAEARRRQLRLNVRTADTPVMVFGDPVQIQQVLINLLMNAMDAVAGWPGERRAIVLAVEKAEQVAGIAVYDRGQGIDAMHLPKLFDSFFSTKRKGMGLGLSIAHHRRGTRWAHLGREPARRRHRLPCSVSRSWPRQRTRLSIAATPLIHVVDDDASLRTALLRLLDAAGFEARGHASTGEFLLHPLPDRPGCLLLDVHMPGPSGLELQSVLLQHGVFLPVVFLTGHADVPSSVRAMKAGALDFLEKPVARHTLLGALQRALAHDAALRTQREATARLRLLFATLTPREREVFDRIVAGKLNKQIADELKTSERTVKSLRAQLMEKLGAESAAELGSLAEKLRCASA